MNDDITVLVRESLDWLTDGATVPAGLLPARQLPAVLVPAGRADSAPAPARRRPRPAVIGLAAATAAAVVAAGAALTVGSEPGTTAGRSVGGGARLTAYVVRRAENALAVGANDVVKANMTAAGSGIKLVSWSDPRGSRTELIVSGGVRAAGGFELLRDSRANVVTIDYWAHRWSDVTLPDSGRSVPALPAIIAPVEADLGVRLRGLTGCGATGLTGVRRLTSLVSPQWPALIRQLLGCHVLTVAGHGQVDGIAAVRLEGTLLPRTGYSITRTVVTLWVGQSTYLPLTVTFASAGWTEAIHFAWLPATAANLAMVNVLPAPAGFAHVPWPGLR